jgi:hypothetical protein
MHRRALLLAALATPLVACDLMEPGPLRIVCDPDLVQALETAATAWPRRRGAPVQVETDISLVQLGRKMELLQGGLIATREPKQANRIQRLGLARLENRWTRDIDGGPVSLVVTRGDFQDEYEARKFARWLASPEADRFVDGAERTVGTSI